ncbi:protein phosphatase 2C domain-containing protein [Taibaiella chishuiensis]|uniref:Protein phosphatase 2C-like protein n=1 Tax=Taibaiella chishuiensis TaxID=1434707 RepID=A0A2P8DDN5_9BACT|nr:protein phosphatase 2C domain-containing protein [Taibaiella chishuiensis]PSK95326.1 protein phosphatase 2C-like protein [Taibaiella chishuiensis]
MKIYSALQIGAYHTDHCEDYLYTGHIGSSQTVLAVMDGCTMGTDSYFAATLVGKILHKLVTEKGYKQRYEPGTDTAPEACLRALLKALFRELNSIRNQLLLDRKELLTTLVIAVIDPVKKQGVCLAAGDGLVCINGVLHEFEQDNKPDYLGFHLDEDFDTWYDQQQQKIRLDDIRDLSIATDGIGTFTPVRQATAAQPVDPVTLLLADTTGAAKEDMLYLQLKKLEHTWGLAPTDDLAIIRVIL